MDPGYARLIQALVDQWIDHQTSDLGVAGSSPVGGLLLPLVVATPTAATKSLFYAFWRDFF